MDLKKILVLLVGILTISVSFLSEEVKAQGASEEDAYHVSFKNGDLESSAPQTLLKGEKAQKPSEPIKNGFRFLGWYLDEDLTQLFDFNTVLTSDVVLYAGWEETKSDRTSQPPNYVTITFDMLGLGGDNKVQNVTIGEKIEKPKDPTAEGYEFLGWYTDENLTQEYDFDTPVSAPLTLYAGWNEIKIIEPMPVFIVNFISNGGQEIKSQEILVNKQVEKPKDPVKEGYKFLGWYTDEALTNAYDFNLPVSSSFVLYAKWEKMVTGVIDKPIVNDNVESKNITTKTLPKTGESESLIYMYIGLSLLVGVYVCGKMKLVKSI